MNQNWAIADFFRQREPRWQLSNAGYDVRRSLRVDGRRWLVALKIHVFDNGCRRRRWALWVSVTIWPPKMTPAQQRRLARSGWYRGIKSRLGYLGYPGEWRESPWGLYGDFWKKSIRGLAGIRKEAAALEKLSILVP